MNNVISTKATVFRNVKDYKFVPKLDENKKKEIVEKVSHALAGDMSVIDLNTADKNLLESLKKSGIKTRFSYPTILVNTKNNVLLTFFEGEHVTISSKCAGYDSKLFSQVYNTASKLADKLTLSYSDDYGYLMSDITKIGVGIRLECMFSLPSLKAIGKIDQVKQNIKKLGYDLIDTRDKDVFVLSTRCNLGFTSSEIFSEFDKMVAKIQDLEAESVKMQAVESSDEILDKYSRAVAILKSAHMINYDELKSHLTTIRVGLNLGMKEVGLEKVLKLQNLIRTDSEFISKSELINLATDVQKILKGE